MEACRANECTDLVILHETRGQPDALQICHLPYGPTAYFTLYNVVLRHDIDNCGTMSEQYPHLIFNNFASQLGKRVQDILKYIFPVPKEDSKRVITFSNEEDYISFRHHTFKKAAPTEENKKAKNELELNEVGPRFEMKLYEIKLGTIEMADTADSEWRLRPYMNTAKKRQFLA